MEKNERKNNGMNCQDDLKEKDEFILYRIGKTACAATNLINSSPQKEETTFGFSYVFILILRAMQELSCFSLPATIFVSAVSILSLIPSASFVYPQICRLDIIAAVKCRDFGSTILVSLAATERRGGVREVTSLSVNS